MPTKPKKPCAYPGCPTKIKGQAYCNKHKSFESNFNNRKQDDWYQTKTWRGNPNKPIGQRGGIREEVLIRDRFTCQECGTISPSGKGLVADHITPFRSVEKDKQLTYFTDTENIQTLCERCHASKMGKTT